MTMAFTSEKYLLVYFSIPESVHRHRPPCSQWEESEGFGYICLRTGLLQGAGPESKSDCSVYLTAGLFHFIGVGLTLYSDWLQELSDQAGAEFDNADVRWVITVPAIWKMPAKQFMREAAYKVQIYTHDCSFLPTNTVLGLHQSAVSLLFITMLVTELGVSITIHYILSGVRRLVVGVMVKTLCHENIYHT